MIYHTNSKHSKARMAILIADKTDFSIKSVTEIKRANLKR